MLGGISGYQYWYWEKPEMLQNVLACTAENYLAIVLSLKNPFLDLKIWKNQERVITGL